MYCDVEEETAAEAADEEKPIVALEKERAVMRDHRADGYGLHHQQQQGQHHHELSSLSDLASRQSTDSLDQDECGGGVGVGSGGTGGGDGGLLLLLQHGTDDPDDSNYPGSCLSAEDSGIHTEDMSSCVSQADDEEQRSNLQPSPVHHQREQHEQREHGERDRERESPRPQRADGGYVFGGDMVCKMETDLNVEKCGRRDKWTGNGVFKKNRSPRYFFFSRKKRFVSKILILLSHDCGKLTIYPPPRNRLSARLFLFHDTDVQNVSY